MAQGSVQVGVTFVDRDNSMSRLVGQGLNQASGQLRTFQTQLDYASRRVLSFGAAASTLYGSIRAFKELVNATVEVEKALTSMNTLFTLNRRELNSLSRDLFNIARQTGQTFGEVSKAAEEFARQGLSVSESMKRTRDAMILVRLTGVDTMKAVQGLTAAMSTFGKTGTDTTKIINQLVAVDQAFAVSAGGIIDAFGRVGSVVDDAGASLEDFIGLVTAARQITARGEAQIGNSLKTIFTRLERSSTLDQLEEMGVAVRDLEGHIKPALKVFEALADSYKNMTRAQQQQVAELGAGVFQINQFKALVKDLGEANGIAAQATNIAANATNEALVRNRMVNQTLATSIQNLKTSAQEASSIVGELAVRQALEGVLQTGNILTGFFKNASKNGDTKAAEDFGAYLGESILKGIGNFLGTGGLALAGRFLGGILSKTIPELSRDVIASGGFDKIRGQEAKNLNVINGLLKQATSAELSRFNAARDVAVQEEIILRLLERQAGVRAGALGIVGGNVRRVPRAAEGFLPAMSAERSAISMGVGGASASARPIAIPHFNFGGGKTGPLVANSSEYIVKNYAGGGSAIFNPDMIQKYGLPPGATPVAAGGYVPNAAGGGLGDLPMRLGSAEYGLAAPAQTIKALDSLLQKLSQTSTLNAAQKVSDDIWNLSKGLDQISRKGISKMVYGEFARVSMAMGAAQAAYPINYKGEGSENNPAEWGLADTSSGQRGAPEGNTIKISNQRRLSRELAISERERLQREAIIAVQATRQQNRTNFWNRASPWIFGGSIAASVGSGFIPQGAGGTTAGQIGGAASGALQGIGFGAMAGGIGGPIAAIVGAGIGALVLGIKGYVDKLGVSFDEIAANIEKVNSAMQRQSETINEVFTIQAQLAEAKASGAKPSQIAQLQTNLSGSLSRITDLGLLQKLIEAGSDPQKQAAITRAKEEADRMTRIRNDLSGSMALVLKGGSEKEMEEANQGLTGAFGALLSNMPPQQRETALRMIHDPEYALRISKIYRPLEGTERIADEPPLVSVDDLGNPTIISPGGMSPDKRKRIEMVQKNFGQAYINTQMQDVLISQNQNRPAGTPRNLSEHEINAIISNLGTEQAKSQIYLQYAALQKQSQEELALNEPGLNPFRRLYLERQRGASNIRFQTLEQTGETITSAKADLLKLLGSARDEGLVNRIKGIQNPYEFSTLARDIEKQRSDVGAFRPTEEFNMALREAINKLDNIDLAEQKGLEQNEIANDIAQQILARQGVSGSQLESLAMEKAIGAGYNGQAKGSFIGGFKAPFARIKQDMMQFAQVGQQVATSLENSLGNAFGDFIVGAQSGKDAFRSFAASVMQDAARAFASKGVQMLLGVLFSAIVPGPTVTAGTPTVAPGYGLGSSPSFLSGAGANFGVPGGATGGTLISSKVMGGEFIFTPQQASRLGKSRLDALNGMAAGGLVRGGSGFKDDVFMRLAAGSYVINKGSTSRLGADNLSALANATTTAMFSSMTATPTSSGGGGGVNVSVGVTINDNSTSSTTRVGGNGAPKDKQFGENIGNQIAQLVRNEIANQTRLGGMLRRQSLANT